MTAVASSSTIAAARSAYACVVLSCVGAAAPGAMALRPPPLHAPAATRAGPLHRGGAGRGAALVGGGEGGVAALVRRDRAGLGPRDRARRAHPPARALVGCPRSSTRPRSDAVIVLQARRPPARRRGRRLAVVADARPAAPGDRREPLRAHARHPLLRLPGARRGALPDRRRRRGAAADDPAGAGQAEARNELPRAAPRVPRAGRGAARRCCCGRSPGCPTSATTSAPTGTSSTASAIPERHVTDVVSADQLRLPRLRHARRGVHPLRRRLGVAMPAARAARRARPAARRRCARPARTRAERRRHALVGAGAGGPDVVLGALHRRPRHSTPGGGFQGGVILATALLLVFLADQYVTLRRVGPMALIELAEASGRPAFVLIGIGGMIWGGALLRQLPRRRARRAAPLGGTCCSSSVAVGLAVTGGFALHAVGVPRADARGASRAGARQGERQ